MLQFLHQNFIVEIATLEKPKGVIVQFGGQTPLNLVKRLERVGIPILGTSPDAIDRAEDRERFKKLIEKLGLKQPPNKTVRSVDMPNRRRAYACSK